MFGHPLHASEIFVAPDKLSCGKAVSPVQPYQVAENESPAPTFKAGNDVKLVIPLQACRNSVPRDTSKEGKAVMAAHPFQVW
jgi:hypothetical protein